MDGLTELLGHWNHSLPEKVDYADLVCAPAFARGYRMVYEDEYGYMVEDTIKALEELQQYRKLEEDGLLLRLPCKVGDTVYRIDTDTSVISEIEPCHIDNIIICNDGEVLLKYDAYDGVICSIDNLVNGTPYLDYYMMYLSLEEAEAKLAEMEDGHGCA